MTTKIDYENKNPDANECINTLVRLLARLVVKEELEKQKSLNRNSGYKKEKEK